jgi:hypothetical protein
VLFVSSRSKCFGLKELNVNNKDELGEGLEEMVYIKLSLLPCMGVKLGISH